HIWRLSGAGSRDDNSIDEEKLCLLDLIQDVEITGQGVRAMFFLNVSKNLDVLAPQFFALPQQLAGATFDDPRATHVREDVSFHTNKIQVRIVSNLQCGFI